MCRKHNSKNGGTSVYFMFQGQDTNNYKNTALQFQELPSVFIKTLKAHLPVISCTSSSHRYMEMQHTHSGYSKEPLYVLYLLLIYKCFDYSLLPSVLHFTDRKLYLHTDFKCQYTTATGKWVKDFEMPNIIFYHLLLVYFPITALVGPS